MKIVILLVVIGCICLSILSFKETKGLVTSESRFYIDSLYSKHLGEYRKHKIYLPKGYNSKKKYFIMYATDGGFNITEKKNVLDSLIDNKIIKPMIFVASYCNDKIADSTSTTTGDGKKVFLSYRNYEYVYRDHPQLKDRFSNHMLYFKDEFIPQVEAKLQQKPKKKDRGFYGVSNGAGFGMSLLNAHPDIIGTYICLSTFGGTIETNTWQKKIKYPDLYLQYGSEEVFILKDEAAFLKLKYKELNRKCEIKEFKGEHSDKNWSEIFIEILSRLR